MVTMALWNLLEKMFGSSNEGEAVT